MAPQDFSEYHLVTIRLVWVLNFTDEFQIVNFERKNSYLNYIPDNSSVILEDLKFHLSLYEYTAC